MERIATEDAVTIVRLTPPLYGIMCPKKHGVRIAIHLAMQASAKA